MSITYYAGNRLTGVSGDTKPTSNVLTGTTFLETNTDDLYIWDGSSWNIVASDTGVQTFANKTFTDAITLKEVSAPGDQADTYGALYIKAKSSTNAIYFKSDDETEYDLTESAASASLSSLSDTTITSPSDAALLLYDTGTSKWRDADMSGIATIDDVGAITLSTTSITGQSAEATVNNANDYVLIYDGSATALKKMTIANLVAGGVSTDSLTALTDTTIASVASAQVLIYDGSDSWDNKTVSGDISINTSGVAAIGSGVILNADVNASAAIDYSKLAALTDGNILVGNGSNVAVSVNPSGDVDVTNAGVFSIASGVIVNADVNSSAAIAISKTALVAGTGITLATNTLNVDAAQTQITSVGALDAGSITSGFGTIDTGSSNITTTGTVTAGNLTVTGTTTTVNTATLTVEDPLIILASGNNAGDAVDIGLYGLYDTSGSLDLYSGLFRDANDSGKWKLFKDLQAAPTTTVNVSGTGYAVGTLVAALEGNATTATESTNITAVANNSTNETVYPTFVDGATGTQGIETDTGFTYNPSTGVLTSTTFTGALSGNATTATALATARTIGGTSFDGSAAIVPATITVADTTDTTAFVALFESATGDLAPKTDAGVTYNAGTGMLTATGFTGPLTGNASGTAATVTGATQNAITSASGLATVGTISTGVWNGTAIVTTYGGTGLASYTAGDIFYYASGTTLTKLAKGTASQVLTMNSGATAPEWAASSGGISVGLAIALG